MSIYFVDPIKYAFKTFARHISQVVLMCVLVGEQFQEELAMFGQQEFVSFKLSSIIKFNEHITEASRLS